MEKFQYDLSTFLQDKSGINKFSLMDEMWIFDTFVKLTNMVEEFHGAGYVHLDLKPDNILMN